MDVAVKINEVYMPYLNKDKDTLIFFGGSSSG